MERNFQTQAKGSFIVKYFLLQICKYAQKEICFYYGNMRLCREIVNEHLMKGFLVFLCSPKGYQRLSLWFRGEDERSSCLRGTSRFERNKGVREH